jgi:hypothetical protein
VWGWKVGRGLSEARSNVRGTLQGFQGCGGVLGGVGRGGGSEGD